MKARSSLLVLALAAATIAGCMPKPASVQVQPGQAQIGTAGGTADFKASVLDKDGKEIPNAKVAWASSAPEVADVADGKVTAKKSGTAMISATAETAKGEATVVVSIPASLTVEPAEVALNVGGTAALTGVIRDDAGQPAAGVISYASGDAAIATADPASGAITAVAAGETTVTATFGALSQSVKVKVNAPPPPPAKGKKK